MGMQVERHYEENISNGKSFKSIKVGLTIKSDKVANTPEEFKKQSGSLLKLAQSTVRAELTRIKDERNEGTQGGWQ